MINFLKLISFHRLADRLVFWVIQGKTVDEIYLAEKSRLESLKQTNTKLTGYIAPEEYELRKNLLRKHSSGLFSDATASSIDSLSQLTDLNSQPSQSSDMTIQSGHYQLENDSIKDKRPLNNSSSKNNLGGIVLRENHDSKSAQKMASFSGKDQKNISPYNDKTRSASSANQNIKTNKLLVGGAINSNLLKVKRQISFDS